MLTNGKILGKHKGFWHYTIGQRKGLGIAYPEPLYVVDLDAHHNRVIVGTESETKSSHCEITQPVWSVLTQGIEPFDCFVKYRSAGQLVKAQVVPSGKGIWRVEFDSPQKSLTAGQSAVFYQDNLVLGGGIIK